MSGLFAAPGLAETVYEILRTDDREETRALRARMEEMWEVFEPYADPHFLIEFRTRLNARYWEMYLARAFIGAGYRVMSDPSGPDLCLTYDGQRIWVEAVEATQGAEGSPDRTPDFGDDSVVDYPEEQVLLRLRNAIDAKRAKRETYLESGLVTPADAYVIAINAGRIPYAFGMEDPPRILNAVYPIGALQIHIRSSDGEVVGVDNAYRPSVSKVNGSSVSTDVFLDAAYSGISGVIYSGSNAWNMPAVVGTDMALVHNLLAAVPLPKGWYPFGHEWSAMREGDGYRMMRADQPDSPEAGDDKSPAR